MTTRARWSIGEAPPRPLDALVEGRQGWWLLRYGARDEAARAARKQRSTGLAEVLVGAAIRIVVAVIVAVLLAR